MSIQSETRKDFPLLVEQSDLVYLDNAATTQKPRRVIDAVSQYYSTTNANIHRGVYQLSQQATELYEQSRETVQRFLSARSSDEIVFTRGTTEGINLIAQTFGKDRLSTGDEILLTELEHHSNIVPWQMVADEVGARIKVVPVNDAGELEITAFQEMLTPQVKLVSVTHVSNTLGTVTPIAKIVAAAHEKNIPVVVDGAQAAAHVPIDVTALDCDFYLISGHKAYGPTGIGVLYGKAEHLKQMRPYHGGGDMILSVTFEGSTFQAPPAKFEAGTPHISGAIGLAEALLYIESLGWENIQSSEQDLLGYALEQLAGVTGLRRIGSPTEQIGVVSFVFDNVHPHDVGTVLDQMNIAVRTGHHCTQPLMKRFAVPATVRISFAKFNTREDVDQLVVGLGKVQELFR